MSSDSQEVTTTRFMIEYVVWEQHSSHTVTEEAPRRDKARGRDRDPDHRRMIRNALRMAPPAAYAFRFFERKVRLRILDGKEHVIELGDRENYSLGYHYINGVVLDESALNDPNVQAIISRSNIKNVSGEDTTNFFGPGDLIMTRLQTIVRFNADFDVVIQSEAYSEDE